MSTASNKDQNQVLERYLGTLDRYIATLDRAIVTFDELVKVGAKNAQYVKRYQQKLRRRA